MLRAMYESELVEHQLKLCGIEERDPYRIVSFEVAPTYKLLFRARCYMFEHVMDVLGERV